MAAGRCHFQTMDKLTLRAPAKLNLLLDITGKRPDGYHEVRMVMQTVSWYDVLRFEKTDRPGISFRVTDASGKPLTEERSGSPGTSGTWSFGLSASFLQTLRVSRAFPSHLKRASLPRPGSAAVLPTRRLRFWESTDYMSSDSRGKQSRRKRSVSARTCLSSSMAAPALRRGSERNSRNFRIWNFRIS